MIKVILSNSRSIRFPIIPHSLVEPNTVDERGPSTHFALYYTCLKGICNLIQRLHGLSTSFEGAKEHKVKDPGFGDFEALNKP